MRLESFNIMKRVKNYRFSKGKKLDIFSYQLLRNMSGLLDRPLCGHSPLLVFRCTPPHLISPHPSLLQLIDFSSRLHQLTCSFQEPDRGECTLTTPPLPRHPPFRIPLEFFPAFSPTS